MIYANLKLFPKDKNYILKEVQSHFKTPLLTWAVELIIQKYLEMHNPMGIKDDTIEATGGTNWKEYLPPSFQKVVFFPELYTKEELNNWGKQWVDHMFNPEKMNT